MAEPTVPAKKPRQNSEYINNPFFIAAEGIKLFFTKAQSIAILLIILSVLSVVSNFAGDTNPQEPAPSEFQAFPALSVETILFIIGFSVVAIAAILAIGTLINGVTAYGSARVSQSKEATLKQGLKATFDQFWSFLWLQVLTVLKVLAWSLLFIIPGIVMAIRYSLANIAFFDKGLKGNAAIKESLALTKGSWITTFSAQALFNLITFSTISGLVTAGSTAILYRQFNTTPLADRPKTHGLSIATFVVTIVGLVLLFLLGVFLAFAISNYNMDANAQQLSA